jgi:hypothetical protein
MHPTTGQSDRGTAWRRTMLAMAVVLSLLGGCKDDAQPPAPADPVQAAFLEEYDLTGKVTLIQFGLIGCEMSEEELEEMLFLDAQEAVEGLSIIRVEASKSPQTIKEYYAAKKPTFPVHPDPDTTTAKAFDATVYPCVVLMGKYGRVRYRGKFPYEKLAGYVEALRAETADPGADVVLFGIQAIDGAKLLAETSLPDLKGTVKSLADYRGKAGLLAVFVSTDCPFAGATIGDMPIVAKRLAGFNLPTVLVNIDDPEPRVHEYYQDKNPGVPILFDVTTGTKLKWAVTSVPTVVLLMPDGQIAYNGKAVWADLAAAAEPALKLRTGTLGFSVKGTRYG